LSLPYILEEKREEGERRALNAKMLKRKRSKVH